MGNWFSKNEVIFETLLQDRLKVNKIALIENKLQQDPHQQLLTFEQPHSTIFLHSANRKGLPIKKSTYVQKHQL